MKESFYKNEKELWKPKRVILHWKLTFYNKKLEQAKRYQ